MRDFFRTWWAAVFAVGSSFRGGQQHYLRAINLMMVSNHARAYWMDMNYAKGDGSKFTGFPGPRLFSKKKNRGRRLFSEKIRGGAETFFEKN